MQHWLLYALGGGLGHLTRAVALARAARRVAKCTVLSNSPYANLIASRIEAEVGGSELVRLAPTLDRHATGAAVRAELERRTWNVLVVDTFVRGLGGELVGVLGDLGCPKVLIHRDVDPTYVAACDLVRFALHYELVLLPGEHGPLASHPRALGTDPWLLREPDERWSASRARQLLGASGELPLVLVVATGRHEEIEHLTTLAGRLAAALDDRAQVRLASPLPESGALVHWPLCELFAGVDVLVGAGGYNTVYEARAAGVPLLAFDRPRRYDRQHRRLAPSELVRGDEELPDRVLALLAGPRTASDSPHRPNGAHQAAAAIGALGAR